MLKLTKEYKDAKTGELVLLELLIDEEAALHKMQQANMPIGKKQSKMVLCQVRKVKK